MQASFYVFFVKIKSYLNVNRLALPTRIIIGNICRESHLLIFFAFKVVMVMQQLANDSHVLVC